MKISALLISCLTIIGLSLSSPAYSQQTQYVSDTLRINFRSGPSNSNRIVHTFLSGTPLTAIEESEDKKWTKVKTTKGEEGWVLTQYLMNTPAARNQLKAANTSVVKLRESNKDLKQQLQTLQGKQNSTNAQATSLSSSNATLSKELDELKAISANAIQLNTDNQKLLNESQMLKNEVDVLQADNQRLTDKNNSDSFLNGAFAVLIGVMITLIVPRLWPRKASDWA